MTIKFKKKKIGEKNIKAIGGWRKERLESPETVLGFPLSGKN